MLATATPLPRALVHTLAEHGYPGARPLHLLQGPLAIRASVALSDGRFLWVDAPAHIGAATADAWPEPPAVTSPAAGHCPVRRAGSAFVYEVPWAAHLLASRLFGAAPPDTAIGTGLGQLLRRSHDALATAPQPEWRVPAIGRIEDMGASGVAHAHPTLTTCWERLRCGGPGPWARLHGEPASGHVLVPLDDSAAGDVESSPQALLTGWTGRQPGPAWFDVGYLIGDLIEIAHLSPEPGRRVILAMARATRTGYDDDGARPTAFWQSARDAAVAKLFDHDARITLAGGSDSSSRTFLTALGLSMLDPGTEAGAILHPKGASHE